MEVLTESLLVKTKKNLDIIDITVMVQEKLSKFSLQEGILTIFVPGATGGLSTVEYEPGLQKDLAEFFERVIPQGKYYHHNERWHDGNGHSHVRASMIGPSLTIPFSNGRLTLGTWQQIILLDFDLPARNREIVLKVIGK